MNAPAAPGALRGGRDHPSLPALEVHPLGPGFGAQVRGLDLREPPTPELVATIETLMATHKVIVLPDQAIDDDQQMRFSAAIGPLEPTPAVVHKERHRLKHTEMVDISNLEVDGTIKAADDRRRMFDLGNRLWHTDSSFKATPAKYSLLHARVIPPAGGETDFADMTAAWDALPAGLQATLRPLVCDHSIMFSRALMGFADFTPEEAAGFAPVPQRLVRRHPATRRENLYLASHIGGIHGWQRPEAMLLVRDLIEHATQREFIFRHSWAVHDLVIWDNRCTMHRGRPFEDKVHVRDMRRTAVQDVAPTLEQPH
ncbi:MAG: TauD/TfdA family dioxygenase [Burkholderiales bacterium]|jgi:alpha-ketoglutarate-dependent 2,4-dichlorophenoxyacetate dioxygenase|nr:TauD/TfdA family dioxygenase [Burkholderiales bacterium]